MIQQPNWLELLLHGNRCRCAQQVKYVGNTDVFCFGFYFVSPKWTRTKLVIEISPSYRPIDAYCLYRDAMGSSAHILKFSLQSASFSLCMAVKLLFSMFWFAIFIFRVLKCEAVIFNKYHLACMNSTSISSFWCAMYR